MRVRDVKPARHETSPGGFRTRARFSFEPLPGVIIFDCTMVEAPDGRMLIYGPPSRGGAQILSLAPDVRREVIALMTDEVAIDSDSKRAA
jgi:hypothetical protein